MNINIKHNKNVNPNNDNIVEVTYVIYIIYLGMFGFVIIILKDPLLPEKSCILLLYPRSTAAC
jgi:hypothetical protein